jgi:hypothetical protein
MEMVLKNAKPLEGAILEISNPPVCNSILVTGINTWNTTKQALEMYFENENRGGGKIYGDVIYQKDQGQAVVSFCDPDGKINYFGCFELLLFMISGCVILHGKLLYNNYNDTRNLIGE